MAGKGREVADMMERRKVYMLCVQETKWRGSKARNIGGGFKLFFHGVDGKRNGVGVILKEEYRKSVVELMSLCSLDSGKTRYGSITKRENQKLNSCNNYKPAGTNVLEPGHEEGRVTATDKAGLEVDRHRVEHIGSREKPDEEWSKPPGGCHQGQVSGWHPGFLANVMSPLWRSVVERHPVRRPRRRDLEAERRPLLSHIGPGENVVLSACSESKTRETWKKTEDNHQNGSKNNQNGKGSANDQLQDDQRQSGVTSGNVQCNAYNFSSSLLIEK
ncbi:hypothetical protein C0J45_12817 [Silurus meridionalis]|uniref:Uncharacterized protein n=1 Tax=Silurus meridionalis TaxID=175797 RepID=A0A8T0AXF9_SILME|nr:hypothetical protein HF521_004712 [Silurus meridionalis]KAI5097508.1 hypothetical protein C0J45_12817 [Silurus meridionalis]